MARLDSPYPPHHRACPEAAQLLAPPLVAALLDGDATVTLRRYDGRAPRPRIIVASRDDDPTPLAIARSVARHRGGGELGWIRRRPDVRRNEWVVDAPTDLLALVAWLDAAARPLAPRLEAMLAVVAEAASLLLGGSVPTSTELADLARRSAAIARSAAPLPPGETLLGAPPDRLWWEVSGLLAADGHLAIRNRHARMAPVAVISQRTDNLALLEVLRDRTGLGDIVIQGTQAAWRVTRAADCSGLVERMRAYPLPLGHPRTRQLEAWASGVAAKAAGRSGRSALVASADALRDARRHRGPRLLCGCSATPGSASSPI